MYESEVNNLIQPASAIPVDVIAQLGEYRKKVRARTILPWGEHCTECVWPSCYTSCELYEPRSDGACRQFVGGVIRVDTPGATVPYLQKITFRRWAKLWTTANAQCEELATADRWERLNMSIGAVARNLPAPRDIKHRLLAKMSYVRRNKLGALNGRAKASPPDYFVMEVYNPSARSITLTLSIRPRGNAAARPFQKLVSADPGLTREKVPVGLIGGVVNLNEEFEIELVPNEAENLTLYFGLIDFVQEKEAADTPVRRVLPERKCKCVVWDLDNTLWDGILIEDGTERVTLRQGALEAIRELDRRGILQSVASKNNESDVKLVLRRMGIDEYFLYPQIGWWPKSRSIGAIANALNIDKDTFVFVDDQPFEREEVSSVWPQVRAIDAADMSSMLERPEFQVTVTEESRTRRLMYRQQQERDALAATFEGDYLGFLKSNQMKVRIASLNEENLPRVYELAQRTNQMNFSGNRYSQDELERISRDDSLETHVLRCEDRFGSYGIVGFAVVDVKESRLLDLMFSCRVQAKRVEHGFIAWLLKRNREHVNRDFFANYRKTEKNAPGGAFFDELGFETVGLRDGVTDMLFARQKDLPVESVVDVDFESKRT